MLGYTALTWVGSNTRNIHRNLGCSPPKLHYVGGPHKGKNLAQDAPKFLAW